MSILPTGKYHVSFSEINVHRECSFRHKLQYVDKHAGGDTQHTVYGKLIHSALQEWLLEHKNPGFDWEDRIADCYNQVLDAFETLPDFKPEPNELVEDWMDPVDTILKRVPSWMNETFPGWKTVASEVQLFEPIEGLTNKWFKGFIDCVIKVPKPPRKGSQKASEGHLYWVIDWKSTSWGWDRMKKQDKFKRMQLALYKHYFSVKTGIPLEDIRCGFVLLKRTAKKESCELIEVSVGDKTREEALKLVASTIKMIAKGWWVKDRNSCRFCDFRSTDLCP